MPAAARAVCKPGERARHEPFRPSRSGMAVPASAVEMIGVKTRAGIAIHDPGVKKTSLPLSCAYRLIEPGPVVLVTTKHAGRANVMTMSWHTMMDFEPPLIGCVIGDRSATFEMLRKSRECANIPTVELASETVGCGNCSGRTVDKFDRFGLTPSPAAHVAAPLVAECYASLECRLADARLAGTYNFFVLEVLKAWIDRSRESPKTLHHQGRGMFMVAGKTIRLPSRMK
jgi:flavin reductase (DIM6/NTAB) family NADH-FMN oxidoreductase RutF